LCAFRSSCCSKMRGRLLSVVVVASVASALGDWRPCTSNRTPCCDPTTTPSQVCLDGSVCQQCGGSVACQCPSGPGPTPLPPAPSTICNSVHNLQCEGDDLKAVGNFGSHQECCSACNALAECNAWSWDWQDAVGTNCYLKSACSNRRTSGQYHSGHSTFPGPPPTPGLAPLGPDLNLFLENKCTYPVRFFWDTNIGGGSPNVLVMYNEKLAAGITDHIRVDTLKEALGRIYVQSSDDSDGGTRNPGVPRASLPDALNLVYQELHDASSTQQTAARDEIRAHYEHYLMDGEPRMQKGSISPPGQLVEFTITHDPNSNERIYDADISNVGDFNGAVSVDMLYPNGGKIDTVNCRNTSMTEQPDKQRCEAARGFWVPYPSATYGPKGLCSSPQRVCLDAFNERVINPPAVCKLYDSELSPLFSFLNTYKAEVEYEPNLVASLPDTARMFNCDGFKDNPQTGFYLASMCSSLNRGQCPMPSTAELQSIPAFKEYVETKCGRTQFYKEDESTWFKQSVRNPWAEYLRKTLDSSVYSFSQDEGYYGGNAQCRAQAATHWIAPSGMRVTACPGGSPAPGPTPGPPAPGSCDVGDHVYCPGETTYRCNGNSCCHDGSTCPSADNTFAGCPSAKAFDCTTALLQDVVMAAQQSQGSTIVV